MSTQNPRTAYLRFMPKTLYKRNRNKHMDQEIYPCSFHQKLREVGRLKRISKAKERILKLLWKSEAPLDPRGVSEKMGVKVRSVNMHLLALNSLGCVSKSENGYYSITESGREAIGFPKVDKGFAEKVLRETLPEKAFHFYSGIGQPTGISSNNLVDFCDTIRTIDVGSVVFHVARGDFELWVHFLGDIELSKKLRLIREAELTGETLRDRLYKALRSRCDELLRKTA